MITNIMIIKVMITFVTIINITIYLNSKAHVLSTHALFPK